MNWNSINGIWGTFGAIKFLRRVTPITEFRFQCGRNGKININQYLIVINAIKESLLHNLYSIKLFRWPNEPSKNARLLYMFFPLYLDFLTYLFLSLYILVLSAVFFLLCHWKGEKSSVDSWPTICNCWSRIEEKENKSQFFPL